MNLEVSYNQARQLADFLRKQTQVFQAPIFVALDGRSGSGKSTIAAIVADELNSGDSDQTVITVIEGDQFYGGGSLSTWNAMSTEQKLDRVIDWRQQQQVLQSLRTQGMARWHSFNWDSDNWDTDLVPIQPQPTQCVTTQIVLLEGVYSARPEFGDLLDIRILLEIPEPIRRSQLLQREGEHYQAAWDKHWSEAEDYYFDAILPASGLAYIAI